MRIDISYEKIFLSGHSCPGRILVEKSNPGASLVKPWNDLSISWRFFLIQILLLFLVLPKSDAQVHDTLLVTQVQLDSIQQLINLNSREDTTKVILLNEYGRLCFYDLQFQEGLLAAKEARKLSEKLNYGRGENLYFKTISHFHRNTTFGDYYLIISDWKSNRGISRDARTDNIPTHPIGAKDSELESIEKSLLSALIFFDKEQDTEITANILYAIFQNYEKLKLPQKAWNYWDQAYNHFVTLGQEVPQVRLLFKKIVYLRSMKAIDEARQYELRAINLVNKTNDLKLKGLMYFMIGNHYLFQQGRNNLSLEYYLKSVDALKEIEGGILHMQVLNLLGFSYAQAGNNEKGVLLLEEEIEFYQNSKDIIDHNFTDVLENQMVWVYTNIAGSLISMNRFKEAGKYLELSWPIIEKYPRPMFYGRYFQFKAALSNKQNRYDEALSYNLLALNNYKKRNVDSFISEISRGIAQYYQRSGDIKKGLEYALESFKTGLESYRPHNAIDASLTVSELYEEAGQVQKSNDYLKIHMNLRDENEALDAGKRFEDAELKSLLETRNRKMALLEHDNLLNENERHIQQLWIFSISGALISVIVLAFILLRTSQNRKKANSLLTKQKEEIENALGQLKISQTQLVHSEKMASLGELTAGIAHEIQNPLNFVNNFSEVNKELMEELKEEIQNGNTDEVNALASDIIDNETKIAHHGKRAEGIVKSMLQHSRASSGEKELTDINALVDEYLRLAYHGFRAKDKSFNADFKAELDESLPKISVVPQDIGRVLLNLINNAFQAVKDVEKPMVTITTSQKDGKVEVRVKDNGLGIPDEIKDKIFQPFFTTKPTGEGTGLGLSLSYDIVTKGHGGQIEVNTNEQKGTEFIMIIPFQS